MLFQNHNSKFWTSGIYSALLFLFSISPIFSQSDMDSNSSSIYITKTDSIIQVIHQYNYGFTNSLLESVRNSIGSQLIMVNGNYSGDPVDWQAHQFLNEKEIDDWIKMMLTHAIPIDNTVDVQNVDFRGNSAIVVTNEKGGNKFRAWQDEEVVYMLGYTSQGWKIVGIFIKNISNPE